MTPMNPEIPTIESLRAKHSQLQGNGNLKLRVHRALSWMERGQEESADPDATFIFHWIGFDALCSGQPPRPATKEKIAAFLGDAVGVGRDTIYNRVIAGESETILTLVANAYVFAPFWDHYYNEWKSPNWADSLIESVERTVADLDCGKSVTLDTLIILFERLVELRNQLVHGGATWKGSVNRDQVEDGAKIMSRLLPIFLNLIMDNPDSFNNSDVNSPPPGLDPSWIIKEHDAYVCRLAKLASEADGGYREYLSKAVEREIVGKDDSFVACVFDILYP